MAQSAAFTLNLRSRAQFVMLSLGICFSSRLFTTKTFAKVLLNSEFECQRLLLLAATARAFPSGSSYAAKRRAITFSSRGIPHGYTEEFSSGALRPSHRWLRHLKQKPLRQEAARGGYAGPVQCYRSPITPAMIIRNSRGTSPIAVDCPIVSCAA